MCGQPRQARALLEAVRAQQPSGPRLVAFFAVMYYAGPAQCRRVAADYAKCVAGQDELAKRRISEALLQD